MSWADARARLAELYAMRRAPRPHFPRRDPRNLMAAQKRLAELRAKERAAAELLAKERAE